MMKLTPEALIFVTPVKSRTSTTPETLGGGGNLSSTGRLLDKSARRRFYSSAKARRHCDWRCRVESRAGGWFAPQRWEGLRCSRGYGQRTLLGHHENVSPALAIVRVAERPAA